MSECERLFSETLHAELKEKIIGGIYVCINEYDELCVKIYREKDLDYVFTYKSEQDFSKLILYGYSVRDAFNDVMKSYKAWLIYKVIHACFK